MADSSGHLTAGLADRPLMELQLDSGSAAVCPAQDPENGPRGAGDALPPDRPPLGDLASGSDSTSRALDVVLERFARMVRSVGRQRRLDEAEFDELLQEIRIRLWRAKREAGPIASLSTSYVYRTAVAAAIDLARRRRRAEHAPLDPRWRSPVAAGQDPEEALAADKLDEAIERALRALPDARRVVVQLHLAGYTKREIVAQLRFTRDKVRNLLYRGLADLRIQLRARGFGA